MATQAQLLTQARYRLDETTAKFFDDVHLRTWINEIARDLARTTESIRLFANITVVAGTSTYTFAPTQSCIRIHTLDFLPTGQTTVHPLIYRDRHAMSEVWGAYQAVNNGYPQFWTSWGAPGLTHQIQLYPIPSVGGTGKVWYYAYPTQLATATSADAAVEVGVPAGWEDVVVDGVEFMALRQDRSPRWQEAYQLYKEKVAMLAEAGQRWSDQAGVMTTDGGSAYPWWVYGEEVY